MKNCILFLNGVSILEIRDNMYLVDENLLEENNGECYIQTDKENFIKCVEKMRRVAQETWSKEFKKQYNLICNQIGLKGVEI